MPLLVHTSRVAYAGPDKLVIVRKGRCVDPAGLPFAPSLALLQPYLNKRVLDGLTDEDWTSYTAGYFADMRVSFRLERAAWNALLARSHVVLCCYCPVDPVNLDATQCHRRLLASRILPALGAEDGGELHQEEVPQRRIAT